MTAGRATGAVTLLLIWTALAAYVWPILRADLEARHRMKRRTMFDALTSERSWHRGVTPSRRVLPAPTAAASSNPPLVAAPAPVPTQRRVS